MGIQVEEIAQVQGVDVLLIGPWDLGNNIGRPVVGAAFHEDLLAAMERIRKAATDNGKKVGVYCTSGESAKKYAEQGFHMVRIPGQISEPSTCLTLASRSRLSQTLLLCPHPLRVRWIPPVTKPFDAAHMQ